MAPKKFRKADFCVIGAGSGGLSFAAGAVQMGASVILVERSEMGGDCLNYGCIPSKALIAAAKFHHEFKRSKQFGWIPKTDRVNFKGVYDHIQEVIQSIALHDSVERFEKLGVKVINREGYFTDAHTLETERHKIQAKRYVIATGSRPFVPSIKGIQQISYYTNETIFDLHELPAHLVVIGGGPIGIELAQAFRRLGSSVTVLEAFSVLPKDDPEYTEQLIHILTYEGIHIKERVKITSISKKSDSALIHYRDASDKAHTITASHVLVATGRRPNLEKLQLQAAGIDHTARGITVNKYLRTTNPRVYAIGDCVGDYQFTHVAGYHASLALKNSIFRLRSRVEKQAIPWVTYTDPELAHVGALESSLIDQKVPYRVLQYSFQENDRARVERKTEGQIKVLVAPSGKVLGATIFGASAGELLFPWVMAIQNHLKISAVVNTIAPYPTLSEVNRSVAGKFYTKKLFGSRMKQIVKFIMRHTR